MEPLVDKIVSKSVSIVCACARVGAWDELGDKKCLMALTTAVNMVPYHNEEVQTIWRKVGNGHASAEGLLRLDLSMIVPFLGDWELRVVVAKWMREHISQAVEAIAHATKEGEAKKACTHAYTLWRWCTGKEDDSIFLPMDLVKRVFALIPRNALWSMMDVLDSERMSIVSSLMPSEDRSNTDLLLAAHVAMDKHYSFEAIEKEYKEECSVMELTTYRLLFLRAAMGLLPEYLDLLITAPPSW